MVYAGHPKPCRVYLKSRFFRVQWAGRLCKPGPGPYVRAAASLRAALRTVQREHVYTQSPVCGSLFFGTGIVQGLQGLHLFIVGILIGKIRITVVQRGFALFLAPYTFTAAGATQQYAYKNRYRQQSFLHKYIY